MARKKHIHKYHRVKLDRDTTIWACAFEDCNHHMPKYLEKLIRGRKSICWNCEQPLILEGFALEMDRPICDDCNPNARKYMGFIEEMEAKAEAKRIHDLINPDKKTGTDE